MSRNIPQVKPWRVRYWVADKVAAEYHVNAPTVLFAYWAARDEYIARGDYKRFTPDRKTALTVGKARNTH